MASDIGHYLPDSHGERVFVFLVLFLVVMPILVILAAEAPLVLSAAIGVGFVAWLARQTGLIGDAEDDAADEPDPLKTLLNRYARGEIDETEFERRLDVLVETDGLDLADASDDSEAVLERER